MVAYFILFFDTTKTFFFSSHFQLSFWAKPSAIISKVQYMNIFFLEVIHNF
jgi:hypothetical protein